MTALVNYVNYRVAMPLDLKSIQNLDAINKQVRKSNKWWLARLEQQDEPHTVIHVAAHIHTRQIVGYVVTTWSAENTIRIDRLLVGDEFRRIRIGTRLLLRVLSDKPPSVTRMIYTVPEQDLDAQLFLKSVGFKAVLPLRENAFPHTETGIGIKFEWNENEV
jgi:ribosomal protein S18 acetylase RimI-like enzyme